MGRNLAYTTWVGIWPIVSKLSRNEINIVTHTEFNLLRNKYVLTKLEFKLKQSIYSYF